MTARRVSRRGARRSEGRRLEVLLRAQPGQWDSVGKRRVWRRQNAQPLPGDQWARQWGRASSLHHAESRGVRVETGRKNSHMVGLRRDLACERTLYSVGVGVRAGKCSASDFIHPGSHGGS